MMSKNKSNKGDHESVAGRTNNKHKGPEAKESQVFINNDSSVNRRGKT